MGESIKTDNGNLAAKLALRRYFLKKYHATEPANVLDCCQGNGLIWDHLKKEFALAGYWGVDVKPKPGRLKLDSARILQQPGWRQNVVDIDTYGLPWKHYLALLTTISRPITVFLTLGNVNTGGGGITSKEEISALGLGRIQRLIPQAFTAKLFRKISLSYLLAVCYKYDIIILEAVEARSAGNARYIGVRLEPGKKEVRPEAGTSDRVHNEPEKEVRHAP